MDPRQRLDSPSTAIQMAAKARQSQIWTALPGIIQSFNAVAMTCEVQPAIQGVLSNPKTGAASTVNLPLLVDCPVQFPGGGGVTLTFPITKGDECLVIFASRCIDAWWQQGGIQPPMVYRMHDLSDGFVLPGVRSQPRVLAGISTTAAQLRSDDGDAYVEVDPVGHIVNIVAPGGCNITGPLNVTGAIIATGEVTGNGKQLSMHLHSGVATGSSNTGTPV